MINKIKGELHIIWSVEDVIEQVKDNNTIYDAPGLYDNKKPIPTREQALEILKIIEKGHDRNYGVTWDSIDCAIDIYFDH